MEPRKKVASDRNTFLSDLFLNEEMSDVRVIVENKMEKVTFPAHSFVLKQRSSVMANMLESNPVEGPNKTIVITDCKAIHIEMVLKAMYKDVLPESYTGLIKLVKMAHKYVISKLTERCVESLVPFVNLLNVYELCQLADTYNLDILRKKCLFLIKRAGFKLLTGDDLKCLSKEVMESIVSADDLNVGEEIDVLWAIWKWGNLKSRYRGVPFSNDYVQDLLKHVRWSFTDGHKEKNRSLGITVNDAEFEKDDELRKSSTIDTPWFLDQCDALHVDQHASSSKLIEFNSSSGLRNLMQVVSLSDTPFYVVGALITAYTMDPVVSALRCSCEKSWSFAKIPVEVNISLSISVTVKESEVNRGGVTRSQAAKKKRQATTMHFRDIMYELPHPIEVRKNQKVNISIQGIPSDFSSSEMKFDGRPIHSKKGRAFFVHGDAFGIKKVFLL